MRRGIEYLFVYGTLRPAARHPLQRWLRRAASWVGTGECRGWLYDLGRYPGLVSDPNGAPVYGDVFRLRRPRAVLRALDRYERCAPRTPQPREYRREWLEISCRGRPLHAWVYVYNREPPQGSRIPSGDYLSAMEVHSRRPLSRPFNPDPHRADGAVIRSRG